MTPAPALGVVIVAAGTGVRFGDSGKALVPLAGRPLLAWSLSLFASLPETSEIVVVAGEHTIRRCQVLLSALSPQGATVVRGGATRADSVRAGVSALGRDIDIVAVHDAARPLVTADLVRRVLASAHVSGAAVPAVPVSDTLHLISPDGLIESTPERGRLRAAQTPQVARRGWLEHALMVASGTTDEAALLRAAGYPVTLVDGDPRNVKITWPADLALAEALLAASEHAR